MLNRPSERCRARLSCRNFEEQQRFSLESVHGATLASTHADRCWGVNRQYPVWVPVKPVCVELWPLDICSWTARVTLRWSCLGSPACRFWRTGQVQEVRSAAPGGQPGLLSVFVEIHQLRTITHASVSSFLTSELRFQCCHWICLNLKTFSQLIVSV